MILHQLHSSELCWLHSYLISSQSEDEMQDFPIVLQMVGWAAINTCCYRRVSRRITRVRHLIVILRFFRSNNYSISSRWEKTRVNDAQNMCSAAMHCCSCMTDPSSWYSTCRFLRAGEYSSNAGDLYERETTRRGIITSPSQCTHSTAHAHTQTHRYTCTCILRTC